jgi:hypothetical protein
MTIRSRFAQAAIAAALGLALGSPSDCQSAHAGGGVDNPSPLPALSASPHEASGSPGHDLGLFVGRGSAELTAKERNGWRHGVWRHAWHHGHWAWWWVVGGSWFFYPEPIYPFPDYVGSVVYYDYYGDMGEPDYYWYYCEDPPGYYPDVARCDSAWEAVPPTP